jgi:divinyl protochlorophyllide a 8-vinyl-reductase
MQATALGGPAGRIGPNAVTRVAEVLVERFGSAPAARVFGAAGLAAYLDAPPTAMVDQEDVIRLHRALRTALGPAARGIAQAAGERTGDYVHDHRIPRPVRALLAALPAPLAARLLLAAITRHAWTFAGSGVFRVESTAPVRLSIRGNPLCRDLTADEPQCDYYAATFERLFVRLVSPRARVREVACEAAGAPACVFEIRWDGAP